MRLIILLLLLLYNESNAQIVREVKVEYGIINQIDAVDSDLCFSNFSYVGYKFLFNIFHIRIITAQKDSLVVGLVYNINKDSDSLFSFKKLIGKPFIFTTSEFTPSDSDFPKMANCDYKTGFYTPAQNSFLYKKPYKSIFRVLDFTAMDSNLWNELKELNK
jgi:hypothetical protein